MYVCTPLSGSENSPDDASGKFIITRFSRQFRLMLPTFRRGLIRLPVATRVTRYFDVFDRNYIRKVFQENFTETYPLKCNLLFFFTE